MPRHDFKENDTEQNNSHINEIWQKDSQRNDTEMSVAQKNDILHMGT